MYHGEISKIDNMGSIFVTIDSKHSPIYVRAHTKKVLMETLFADSLFLADHTVMDYSLLCGIDKDTNELVIGIIGKPM